ncbi:Uncharacterized membrane protein YhaH, DUF805 family [Fodinibius salinus]|uniref:Uncharacterized membrane protein YhaH, DUF805 family n=1 Tax=Fodinibius salinus TaxID=860790 RepID=A0A5D3YFJ9_9BACT|nr:DUF805 domain-containing protein [Fodinibius salinus]TYP92196.1 Uncharacterized membrane protein YhaH, DUF805 family [Fodinibius salinus]
MEWYMKVLRQYADFNGRARRKEFWMFTLINFLIYLGLYVLAFAVGASDPESALAAVIFGVIGLYGLGILIPSLAVSVRRLHDTGRSGWWILIQLVPAIGAIVLIVFLVQDSDTGANEYGENPKGPRTTQPL